MKSFKKSLLTALGCLALASSGSMFLTACEDGGMEEAGEAVDDAADDAADAVEDATD